MASFKFHLPIAAKILLFVPHDEVSRTKERLYELLTAEQGPNITIAGSACLRARALERCQEIVSDGEGEVFSRAYISLHDRLDVFTWSMVFVIAKERFRIFNMVVGPTWKLDKQINELNNYFSFQLDYAGPMATLDGIT